MKLVIRLDDICPGMNCDKFCIIRDILLKNKVCAVMGVIPNNESVEFKGSMQVDEFVNEMKFLVSNGWEIAQHGHNHVLTQGKGMLGIHLGEFPGLPYEVQNEKIKKGKETLISWGMKVKYFYPPAHAYDMFTIKAVRENGFVAMLDGRGIFPWEEENLIFVPQIFWRARKVFLPGVSLVCLHPNLMEEKDFLDIESFLLKNRYVFSRVGDVIDWYVKNKKVFDWWFRLSNKMFSMADTVFRKGKNYV